jgi:cytochrome c oxidase subunit 2
VVLTALLVYGVGITGKLRAADREAHLEIRVIAHQFWWEVLYPGAGPGEYAATANELRLPHGRPVTVRLTSRDVVHSFWIPNLAGKIDMIPGRVTQLTLEGDSPGFFRGQCAEFCGASHAHMALEVHVLGEAEFERWLASLRGPTRSRDDPAAAQGRDAFLAQGCGNCHAVQGVSQPRIAAPDLTHFAAREFLGAGVLRNTQANRLVWLTDGERVKPGRAMPSYGHLDARTLAAIADYLGTLR